MSIAVDRSERRVIPRLRESRTAIALGEVAPLSEPAPRELDEAALRGLAQKIGEWESEPTVPYASDAIGAALVLGRAKDVGHIARSVLESEPDVPAMVRRLAQEVLGGGDEAAEPHGVTPVRARIAELRRRLRSFPGNALNWLDLAQAHASSANNEAAARAMNVALGLMPNHRLALRSGARLFVQVGEHDRALWHLRGSAATKGDPWLAAAEIAVAQDAKVPPKMAGVGKRMIAADALSPFHLSELKSAIGMLELGAGGSRRARQLLRGSLDDPSENAVAQAEWVSSMRHIPMPLTEEAIGESREATAIEAFARQEWSEALDRGVRWFEEEPFSSQAVMLVSHMAATLDDRYQDAIPLLEFGVRANEDNWNIWNNLAFCQIMAGQLDAAAATLRNVQHLAKDNSSASTFLSATSGLLAYRLGLPEEGRRMYSDAMDMLARLPGDQGENRANAAAYWAQEEGRVSGQRMVDVISKARTLTREANRPYLAEIMARVEAYWSQPSTPTPGLEP